MLVFLPFVLSLDSLFASLALGVSRIERGRQIKLAVAFGICDGTASLARTAFDRSPEHLSWLASQQFRVAVGVYLAAVFLVWLLESGKTFGAPLLWTVPVALSLDNLAGPRAEPLAFTSLSLVVIASASMSLVGFQFGAFLADLGTKVASHRAFLRRQTS